MASTDSPRPAVTLAYAQSLDGSIAARPNVSLAISGPQSLAFTHQLRASHGAILVGIGTVLSDNPQLNVRLAPGPHPRPIILDSCLRCPVDARCLETARRPIVATSDQAPQDRQCELESIGVRVLRLPSCIEAEAYIDLPALLERLAAEGIQSLMVEGGARVITSFLRARLVDQLIVTIAPTLIGGVRGVSELLSSGAVFPRLRQATLQSLGDDWLVSGEVDWSAT
jgi:GTP cyclohydrolase II